MGRWSKTRGRSAAGQDQRRLCQPAGYSQRRFSVRAPARQRVKTDVLIVGAGPVGLALIGELGWRGISCTIIEKTSGEIIQPKMDLVGVRTMEFCRRWGIADWVRASPYPRYYRQDYIWVSSVTGFEFGREPFPTLNDEPCPPQSPEKRERCPQDMFDPILARLVRSFPQVAMRYCTELTGFVQHADGVTAKLVS